MTAPGITPNQQQPEMIVFKEPQTSIDLSIMTRLGYIISKFEQYFRPNSLIINGNVSSKMNNQNLIYLQQISVLIEYIENNNLLKIKLENSLESTLQQQSSQHVQMLILLIRDWMLQFYLDKNFIYELFPSTSSNEGTTFSLVNIKENNVFLISLLIFNIFYKLRNSFSEYSLLLEFSWICFTDLEPYIGLANLDSEYIYSMLQSSLLSARVEEEQETQINSQLYKQIDMLNQKILETKKRMLSLDASSSKQPIITGTNSNKVPMKIIHSMDSSPNNKSAIKIIQATQEFSNKFLVTNRHQQQTSVNLSSSKVFPASSSSSTSHLVDHSLHPNNKSPNEVKRIERPYKCEVCLKSFPTSYKLNRHSYSHSGERPYMCSWPNCDKRFNDNYHLRRHMNTHTGEKPYPCKYPGCPKRYSRSEDLRNHQKTHFSSTNVTNIVTSSSTSTSNTNQHQTIGANLSQHHQSTAPSSSSLHPHHQQQSNNGSQQRNLVLVQQSTTIIPPSAPQSPEAAKSPSNHHHHHSTSSHSSHHQQQSHHRMAAAPTNAPPPSQQSTDQQQQLLQNQLNQLQQQIQQQQNYSSAANAAVAAANIVHHTHPGGNGEDTIVQSSLQQSAIILQETTTRQLSSPQRQNNQQQPQTNNPQQNSAANMQQHLTENYF